MDGGAFADGLPMSMTANRSSGPVVDLSDRVSRVVRGMLRLVGLLESTEAQGHSTGKQLAPVPLAVVVVIALIFLFVLGFAIGRMIHCPPMQDPVVPDRATTIQVDMKHRLAQGPSISRLPVGLSIRES